MAQSFIHEAVRGFELRLATQPGVFAHRGIDAGTRLLVEAMRVSPPARVLGLGCGYRCAALAANPPPHGGREVLDELVAGAYRVLRPRGQLYIVINRLLSLRREVESVFGSAETVARSKGYVVIQAVKTPRMRDDQAAS